MSDPNKMPLAKATIRDVNGEIMAMSLARTPAEALQIATDIKMYMDAPLIVLGRSESLRIGTRELPQWDVIHEGERKLMTESEVRDAIGALGFGG